MAIARDTTVKNIKPLGGAIVRQYTTGAAVVPGEIVSMQSDGYVDPANTTAAAQTIIGIALPKGTAASLPAGEVIDVVVWGPVQCVTGGTPGATLHATDTAGEPGESAGSNAGVVGIVESATVVIVRP